MSILIVWPDGTYIDQDDYNEEEYRMFGDDYMRLNLITMYRELVTVNKWNDKHNLPSPGIPLKLKLKSGEIIDGVRPSYIENRNCDDLGYRDELNNVVTDVVSWSIK